MVTAKTQKEFAQIDIRDVRYANLQLKITNNEPLKSGAYPITGSADLPMD